VKLGNQELKTFFLSLKDILMVSKTIKIYYQRQHDTLKEYWSGVKISTPSIVSGMLLFTIGNATVKTVYKKSTSKCTRCMFIIIFFENFERVE
jgi:hypothetical protein